MISITKEEKVRALLSAGLSTKEIARVSGIASSTVLEIRIALDTAKRVSSRKRQRVVELLKAGLPLGQIEVRTRIPANAIHAIRRVEYLQKRFTEAGAPRTCPTCGAAAMLASGGPRLAGGSQVTPRPLTANESGPLLHIVEDAVALRNEGLVTNPLFYNLACRAEEVLNAISGDTHESST